MTFPYPRNRIDGPPYACLKEAEQELLPVSPGEHGVIVVKSLPETLVRSSGDWAYGVGSKRVPCFSEE